MNPKLKPEEQNSSRVVVAWKCSADGKHFATFDRKKCRYCVPVYGDEK